MTEEGLWLQGLDPYSERERSEKDYYEPCEEYVPIPEDDEFDREPDEDGMGYCGGNVVSTGGQSHYNGHYDCYTLYLLCDRCGPYEVECV